MISQPRKHPTAVSCRSRQFNPLIQPPTTAPVMYPQWEMMRAAWTKTSWCQTVFVTGREQQTTARFTFQLRLSRVSNTLGRGFISLHLDPYLFQIFRQVCGGFTQRRQSGNTQTQNKKQFNQLTFYSFIKSHSNKILLWSSSSAPKLYLNIPETRFCV